MQGSKNRIVQEFGDRKKKTNFVKAAVRKISHRAHEFCVDQNGGYVEENFYIL